MKKTVVILFFTLSTTSYAQLSVARKWNEVLLEAIRHDLARPTVHARNLFHLSAATYDTWAIVTQRGKPYLIANELNGFSTGPVDFLSASGNTTSDVDKAISYAAYRLLKHRFAKSPGWLKTSNLSDSLLLALGYDPAFTSIDFSNGSAAALGNYIAQMYISYGYQDGSNETNDYANQHYTPINDFLDPNAQTTISLDDPNRWQPLAFDLFIDQSGNEIPGSIPEFLSPEWGEVWSFALDASSLSIVNRDDYNYHVYHDPGSPPFLGSSLDEAYKWGFSLVAIWSSHLDADNSTEIDISPASIGNISIDQFPTEFNNYGDFYKYQEGGDIGTGWLFNPATEMPYVPQVVKLGDYARVLAEFWADGPDSETPPGHWFTLLNYVSDHPDFERKWMGTESIDQLEWDIKAYFTLGGAMHDAAIAAWGVKGYYDYIRPISAIRYMASKGQSSDPAGTRYHEEGIPLVDGFIELVESDDPLAIEDLENIGEIKLWAWKGHPEIDDPNTDHAGVGWILAKNWWPYQRPTFVTPPFAGYVSGHSTYSRAAAEVLTAITGDVFFPGGLGEFVAKQNEFLVFEEGPSEDIILQWATYRDASDQCSLSRIWGGIHPPADDIPGRIIGEKIGVEAVAKANAYFEQPLSINATNDLDVVVYPNPTKGKVIIQTDCLHPTISVFDLAGNRIMDGMHTNLVDLNGTKKGVYLFNINCKGKTTSHFVVLR